MTDLKLIFGKGFLTEYADLIKQMMFHFSEKTLPTVQKQQTKHYFVSYYRVFGNKKNPKKTFEGKHS
jgi:hypothetical protein